MKLRVKIHTILPIVLSLVLPGLSIYSNTHLVFPSKLDMYFTWFISSAFLYLLWQVLWSIWDIKSKYRNLWFLLVLLSFTLLMPGTLYLILFRTFEGMRWILMIRFLFVSFLMILIQYALKTQHNVSRLLLEKEQAQTENYKAQLKALQLQINPHFLFNSLNTLRSMVRQQHTNSEKFILSLSDFYRQTLRYNEDSTLQLSEELTVLESYLFLMKSRNEKAVFVNIRIDESVKYFHIPTLALQLVVENCFKHNSMTSKNPLKIEIVNTDDYYIMVTNNIQPRIGNGDSSGYGLDLLKKRYELMNVPKGVLIEQTSDHFSIKLKLV